MFAPARRRRLRELQEMSDGLAVLIRLRRWRLDEERRQLGRLSAEGEQARQALAVLEAEVERERQSAADEEVGFAYAVYADRARRRRSEMVAAVERAEAAAAAQREVMLLCHREMRSAELAEEARAERQAREFERREQIASDELALMVHVPSVPEPSR